MKFNVAIHTDVGIRKETNQDSLCLKQAETDKGVILLAIICDGMGGLEKGEVASATVITAFSKWFETELTDNPYDVRTNVYTAAKFISDLHVEHEGDMTKVLTQYNTGKPKSHSTAYSRKVIDIYEHLLAMRGKERSF